MARPGASGETDRTAGSAQPAVIDEADHDGWMGPVDDPGEWPPTTVPSNPDPPPAGSRPAPPAGPGGGPRALPPVEHNAAHLHETSAASYLYCSMASVFRSIGPASFKLYLLQTLEAAGNPIDPIERMLIEQICLSHHNIGRLHVKAASAGSLEEARVYLGSAALLTGEFRRSISTLKSYREPARAPAGKADAADRDAKAGREGVDGELGSNTGGEDDEGTIPLPESQAGRGGPQEQGSKARAHRRRA